MVLALCMLFTGTINTIATKYQVRHVNRRSMARTTDNLPSSASHSAADRA
jgi:hypothetical protein